MIRKKKHLFTHCAWCLALCAMLYSCGSKDTVQVKGSFSHLRDADFFIYSTDGGLDHTDTIHVVDGQFEWQAPLEREATFYIIFPNMSEQVVFAYPGDVIKLKGDAQQLRSTRISGNDDNEQLTEFRLKHLDESTSRVLEAMQTFINEHPDSRVSTYFRWQITLQKAAFSRLRKGHKLPDVVLQPDGITAGASDTITLKAKQPVLLLFWATWKRDSYDCFFSLRRFMKSMSQEEVQLRPIAVSLDTDPQQYRNICRYDSVNWDSRCYCLSWGTPIVEQFGLREVPFYVLTDEKLVITAIGTDWKRDIEPQLKKQFPKYISR